MIDVLLTMAVASAMPAPRAHAVDITLAPRLATVGSDDIGTIDVTLRFDGITSRARDPVAQVPYVVSGVRTAARLIGTVEARDAKGVLKLDTRDAPASASGGDAMRQWIANRPVSGGLTLRYAIPASFDMPGPSYSFRNDAGATSGAGYSFLLLPPGDTRYGTTIRWDLSALPRGARGLSSLGEGTVTAASPLTMQDLQAIYFMAGRITTSPAKVPPGGFFAAWQGTPPFDARALMGWTGGLYRDYARFFHQKSAPPYGVFLRFNPYNAGGGNGLYHSFVMVYGKPGGSGTDVDDLRLVLAHEMFHTFQPYLTNSESMADAWFAEGLAMLYQRRLPLRFGLLTPTGALANINEIAGRYYTNPYATLSNEAAAAGFWSDTRVRMLSYDRGMLYLATVDDALRKASGGTRSLDDLVLALLDMQDRGTTPVAADWERLLRTNLGVGAVSDFRAFLGGRMPLPASDAFGPCYRRVTKPLRRYDVGYDTKATSGTPRIVHGLIAGSEAARAGLRDGDEIVSAAYTADEIQGMQDQRQTLSIRRDGRAKTITYLPRGETVDAYQWERIAAVPDARCAL